MKKHHHALSRSRRCYGLEVRILKQIPFAFIFSGIMILVSRYIAHWLLIVDNSESQLKQSEFIDIIAISSLITIWTAIFTVAIGAIAVYIMKGPVYTADSLELIDSEQPLDSTKQDKQSSK